MTTRVPAGFGMVWASARAAALALGRLMTGGAGPRGQLSVGDEAPDFLLPGSDGRTYRLRDYRGHLGVVLAWFPKAFTPGCTVECRSMRETAPRLAEHKVRQFAVSTDDPRTNAQFAASLGLDYPVLSDRDGAVGRAYGVVGRTGFASRWTFYIGTDGRIRAVDKAVQATSHGEAIVKRVAELGLGG